MNCLVPEYLSDQFIKRSFISTIQLRSIVSSIYTYDEKRTPNGQQAEYMRIQIADFAPIKSKLQHPPSQAGKTPGI